jgi:glycosyltransferase involved in cell wall biosynthesis
MGLKIAMLSRDNGVGLSLDSNLLTDLFTSAGHEVSFYDWQDQAMPHSDVAFHLELVSRNLAQCADRNIAILNLEWYPAEWMKYLPAFDQIWAKSAYALRFCRNRGGKNVQLTGFLGIDLYDPLVKREVRCMHLRGRSGMKGTDQVIEAWRRAPDLPPLTIISKDPVKLPDGLEDRVEVVMEPSDEERNRLMNRAEIHVCPSIAEGWGHYITEAMSVGATVITTDASPMNEHIRPQWGYLLGVTSTRNHHQAVLTYTSPNLIVEAVRRAVALKPERRRQLGQATRAQFLKRNAEFKEIALRLVER